MRAYDPHESGVQYLEDMACAYWQSELLYTAIDLDVFTHLQTPGMGAAELAAKLECNEAALCRFLDALTSFGLLGCHDGNYANSAIADTHLVPGKPGYQGNSILWRKQLEFSWRELTSGIQSGGRTVFGDDGAIPDEQEMRLRRRAYIQAMDDMAEAKTHEILELFVALPKRARILDVGAGSGAVAAGFMNKFPDSSATLMDIAEINEVSRELMSERGLSRACDFLGTNILEQWPSSLGQFDLIIMSNIVHAFSEADVAFVFIQAAAHLAAGGMILVHDFFQEHFSEKAALFDLNMLINTYNGGVHPAKRLTSMLASHGLTVNPLLPLAGDTGLIVATKPPVVEGRICIDQLSRLTALIRELGFSSVEQIALEDILVVDWAAQRCQFGCPLYGHKHCPPNGLNADKTRKLLSEFSTALLLEGEPPGREFQKRVVQAERLAFAEGYYKAFAFWAGPCDLCNNCTADSVCSHPADVRPSMEGAGIDVFGTVRGMQKQIKTLGANDFVKYFGLLLVE
ncbi:MAG: DUF2284 domain-containing protein [Coriobacteriales bacterium]|jgi:predicted metal-binding protein/predicted O-methyltransferase YrrM|nr:DUF2284 domain-containing protein [Coriobacteriales bacterium]